MAKTPAKRAYHHGNLRAAVLQAAEHALENGGIGSISLREISRSLNVSHTAPRRHFATKQALLDALAIDGYEQLGRMLSRILLQSDSSFEVRLQQATAVLVRFALKHPALLGHMFAAKHQPDASAELLEASVLALSSGVRLFAEGQETGDVIAGDPEILALVPFATVQGLIVVSNQGTFKGMGLKELVEYATHHILVGLRPRC
ncbi:TetR/AcrR family transcriptional regulator [Terriglobus sp.]|uniref:TetR/AcrR family transcriptional regulator n=1 Tax=Terriglobus sp. TaxID=1889013 RepID=UPI003B0083EB